MSAELNIEISKIYFGSNGESTTKLYRRLEELGPIGVVAVNLFRACKASERAKVYRGRGFRDAAYDRKQWSMDNLCAALAEHGAGVGVTSWGWGLDDKTPKYSHVLYIEIPTGQVSFHNASRGAGPDYGKEWDGAKGQGATRIIRWCTNLLEQRQAA